MMIRILVVLALLGLAFALTRPVEELRIALPFAAIAIGLVVLWLAAGLVQRALARLWRRGAVRRAPRIVVDGSNVMHWHNDTPSATTLMLVLHDLRARGFVPLVFFDANVGYKLFNRAIDARDLAYQLDLPAAQVTMAPSRTPADPLLIGYALRHRLSVVSNDRFMDWRAEFPGIRDKGFLVPGGVKGERVELRFAVREAA